MTIEPLVANHLIPRDKGEGAVRPIGVGEVLTRICGKCVMSVAKKDVVEAAVHAMHTTFESDDTNAILLIDTSNVFNALNRAVALHNIRILCPIIAIYTINTYRQPARLFVIGRKEIVSAEGTTQSNPLTYGSICIQPLIMSLQAASSVKQCWFADDASRAGSITEIRTWWDALSTLAGPDFGYFPNNRKCWIIAKPAKKESVREAFKDMSITVTVHEPKHLGAAIGSRGYLEEYVSKKVTNWINDIAKLAEFALSQPQACYATYTFGLKHQWT